MVHNLITNKSVLVIGSIGAVVGAGIGLLVLRIAPDSGYNLLPLSAAVSAFLCSSGFWWLLLYRTGTYTPWRGILSGALAGSTSHYLSWYLMILGSNVCYWAWRGCSSSLGEPPVDPISGLWGAAVFSVFSLLFFGWVTIGIGMLTTGILASWLRKIKSSHPV